MSDTIILETPRLVLTMWHKGDAALIQQLHSTIDTTRYLSGAAPWTLEKAEERLKSWFGEQARDGVTKYKMLRRDDGRFIGRAGFSRFQEERGRGEFELGYSLSREAWGNGYATEIAGALSEWFFKRGIAREFIAFTHPENAASQRVLRKIGMRERPPMVIDGLACPSFGISR
ncbi:GNAT family N-acetyltransferase [Agrobacterium sp. SHOUNA12C]|uniref:Acetyltransferase protein n=2 Tax=Rhizobium rhizogenes TaxID=359 RepID=B9JFM0_RHIR8|nr:GNAT family N-acetyltransferase [Rhizobium rhizogenes]ACM26710.1 acetyltransferase protein [Rhizobium rhizogenes K84]KAA6489713.1 N-acetyltransferase [Agrobacterium sp. ICMP 7243]MCJ9721613.1 GNAT family N-acetyltransferase [Agrobacterium sp. BETTINA12B]MCJ9756393.1 GNAT family N-acetyltransferase [Agrobacterium sp. SHOUNA12C]OCJ06004.1 acetyltransferase [Agrobacterium sp. 13-626]OCJ25787.1 acetyltransferase [Agrobacterium sp. B131/95]OCJ31112.1 acetyltransferase [Agrobacterium sp. B133/9